MSACGGGGAASGTSSGGTTGGGGSGSGNEGEVVAPPNIIAGQAIGTVTVAPVTDASGPIVATFGVTLPPGTAENIIAQRAGANIATQIDVKRRHADGTIRHAIISTQLPDAAGGPIKLATANTSATGGAELATMLAGTVNYTVEIREAGTSYRTSLRDALKNGGDPWLSGPLVNEWRARVAPVDANKVAHPGLRVLFDARFENSKRGRASITIENVESTAARGDRTYDITMTDERGTVLFTQTAITQPFQTRYRKVFQFGGAASPIVAPDVALLKKSRAILNYTDTPLPASAVDNLVTRWQKSPRGLFDSGIITSAMPNTGGRMDIGPLPGWTVIALLSGNAKAHEVMYDAAERAGVFSIHYRDAETGDIISINRHPTLTLGSASEWSKPADRLPETKLPRTTPHQPDTAHQPSLAFVPYLLSGDRYYLDELYFWADWNMISMHQDYRELEKGLLHNEQVRGQAWSLRTLAHAAWIAPSKDWQAAYFDDKVRQNLTWYVANAIPMNPLGWWKSKSTSDGSQEFEYQAGMSPEVTHWFSPWMHDFFALTLAQCAELGFPSEAVRDWALGFTAKRFTSAPDFSPFDGTSYRLAGLLKGNVPIATMADLTRYTFYTRTTGAPTELHSVGDSGGYAMQAYAALGAAYDAGVSKAEDAFVFVREQILKKGGTNAYLGDPTWNILPRKPVTKIDGSPGLNGGTSTPPLPPVVDDLPRDATGAIKPEWFAALPLNAWTEMPGSRLLDNVAIPSGFTNYDLLSIVYAWGGAALDTKRNGLHLFGGGHNDGKWNGLLFFGFDSYRWTTTWGGTPRDQILGNTNSWSTNEAGTDSLNADGNPMASHGWYGYAWIPERDELFIGVRRNVIWDLAGKQWRKPFLDWGASKWSSDIQAWAHKGRVYVFCAGSEYGGWIFDPAGQTTLGDGTSAVGSYTKIANLSGSYPCRWKQIAVHMPERGEVLRIQPRDSQTPTHVLTLDDFSRSYKVDPTGKGWEAVYTELPLNGNVAGAAFAPGATRAEDRVYILENASNGRLWEINPNDWSGKLLTTTGTGPGPAIYGYYGRFVFDRKHGVLMAMPAVALANGSSDVPNVRIIRVR
ncbi:hypothetical protein [Niveibacterium sp.]|uniref:hypothetical protein n=1 Tax=Niveibacterium sp. TaxID=2017444 RepID=UPI0035AE9AAF